MNDSIITYFAKLKQVDTPHHYTLQKAIDRITKGAKSKELILKIREEKDKSKRNKLKENLPCIIFQGKFSQRNKNGLVEHSGLMITDFDGFETKNKLKETFELLKDNKHIVLLFTSPSGNGLKAVVKIPKCTHEEHTEYFKAFQEKFNYDYWDNSNSDVSRICYESYDPKAYINLEAETFNTKIIDKGFEYSQREALIPLTDESKIIERIVNFNWNHSFTDGNRNNFIHFLALNFCEYGVSEHTAESYIISNYKSNDFKEREILQAVKSAYKRGIYNSKYFEDKIKLLNVKKDITKGKDYILKKHKIDKVVYDEVKEFVDSDNFWRIEKKKDNVKVSIDYLKYKLFLETNGFKKYFPHGSQKPTFVKIDSNKVEETSEYRIKDFVLNYLLEIGEEQVYKYCVGYQNLYSENFLNILETIELTTLKDTQFKSYIAFNNGVLEISKNEIKLIDYIDVNGYIWKNHIIARDFIEVENYENDYQKFIGNVSSTMPLPFECVIGYFLHNYKNKRNNKAVIFNDESISDNPEGGTGKGVFIQGLSQIRNVAVLDGKTFDDKKSFPYQTVSLDTQVLFFDDVKKNFNFENKFSLITEGITLERKNKDAIKLKVEESPKVGMTTNYAIRGAGNSHDRRRHELEFCHYYGKSKTPYDEFGKELFDEWDSDEYLKFDNYMVKCIQIYMKEGLVQQDAKNIKLRRFVAETSMEFYEWVSDTDNLPLDNRHDKAEYFNKFIDEYKDYKHWLKRKTFNIWLQKFASYEGYEFSQGSSNGQKWFEITSNNNEDIGQDNWEENNTDYGF